MSGTSEDAEHAYFQAIEAAFVRLRGSPFLLSPADWRLTQDWHRRGVPLEVVDRALAETFARRAERGETRKVQSLRYCRHAVEEAWEARRELGAAVAAAGSTDPLAVESRLRSLAAALPPMVSAEFGPRVLGLDGEAPEVEAALALLDRELLAAAERDLDPAQRVGLEGEVEAALAGLIRRLPTAETDDARRRLRAQALRRRAG
ncbi:MAG: hypothetical protein ACRD0X_05305, partial [Thermoanaerobaculia bacterium]